MSLIELGQYRLASGNQSFFKLDCDALTDDDILACAVLLHRRLPEFGRIEGVPAGGLRLATAMKEFATTGPLLIVDDVVTTGGSMEKHRAGREAIGACIFFRPWPGCLTPEFAGWLKAALFVMMPEEEEMVLALPALHGGINVR